MASTILLEIQGLRGIAIISVFLFHLWPNVFPNGYVGVDIFFVISGYLMAMIFSKQSSLSIKFIADFYYKRAKRILSLYYFALPLIFISSYLFIGIAWLSTTDTFALYSLSLLKNMKTIWDGDNYFTTFQADTRTKDIFLHLWSIAVEIQFYLIVPFIFLLLQIFKKRKLKIVILLIVCSISYGIYYYSNPIFSFNSCLSRMWQFGLGMLAFISMDKHVAQTHNKRAFLHFTSPILIFAAFIPSLLMIFPQEISGMRELATLSSFCLLLVETHTSKKILSHRLLTYFGDISYSLYLIHWPLIILFGHKYSPQFIIVITLVLSTISYEYYENWYRKLSQQRVVLLFTGLFLLNLWVFLALLRCPVVRNAADSYYYGQVPSNMREALRTNVAFSKNAAVHPKGIWNSSSPSIHPSLNVFGIWDYPKGNGKRKVAILGNSYTVNQVDLIHEEFCGNYSEFKVIAGLGLTGLYDHWASRTDPFYHGQHEVTLRLIEDFKPDVLFLVSRFGANLPDIPTTLSKNSYVQEINKNIDRLERSSGRILIHGPTPNTPSSHLNMFIEAISDGKSLDKFHLDKKVVNDQMQNIRSLMTAIQCAKCQVYDIGAIFLDGNHYLAYDPQTNLSYFDNTIHLTPAGLELVRPMYTAIISKL